MMPAACVGRARWLEEDTRGLSHWDFSVPRNIKSVNRRRTTAIKKGLDRGIEFLSDINVCSNIRLLPALVGVVFIQQHLEVGDLMVPRTRTITYGSLSIPVSGPRVWNDLPPTLRASSPTLGQFQSRLKTTLFRLPYGM